VLLQSALVSAVVGMDKTFADSNGEGWLYQATKEPPLAYGSEIRAGTGVLSVDSSSIHATAETSSPTANPVPS
jgi:hypothetical protein